MDRLFIFLTRVCFYHSKKIDPFKKFQIHSKFFKTCFIKIWMKILILQLILTKYNKNTGKICIIFYCTPIRFALKNTWLHLVLRNIDAPSLLHPGFDSRQFSSLFLCHKRIRNNEKKNINNFSRFYKVLLKINNKKTSCTCF